MHKILFLIWAFWALLSGYANAQDFSDKQWQHNPAILKNARVDALLKSHKQISKVRRHKSITPVPNKTAYGFLMDNNEPPEEVGMIAFQLPKPDIYSTIMPSDLSNVVWSGVYVDDVYYAMMVSISPINSLIHPTFLASIDLKTGERRNIADISYLEKIEDRLTALTLNDMTYDHSTSTVYATANTGLFESSIYKLSLTDGSITLVAKIDQETYLLGLACSYDGQMYGVATGGNLYKIDKETGKTTLIGNTGYKPWYVQSMDFDHTDNTLYWAGADGEHTFIAKIDTKTAETYEMGTFAYNSQIFGLHIPFTRVLKGGPSKVTEVEIIPEQKGGLSATLSWANPISDPFGNKLSGNIGIKIYRDNVVIADIPDKSIGEKCSYTDRGITSRGNYNYKIIPYNTVGNGETYRIQSWIGEDYPTTLNNLVAMAAEGGIQVKWDIPVNGTHGGWINPLNLKYTVIRIPDNVTVATAISESSYTDSDIKNLARWKYKVIASDAEGNSSETNSDSIVAGSGLMPYYQDFSNDNALDLFGVYNLNKDDRRWKVDIRNYEKCAMYWYNPLLPADDWLVTPPIKMEAQHRYRISFDLKLYSNSEGKYKDKLSINLGKSSQPQYQTLKLDELEFDNTTWRRIEKEIVVDEATNYYIGLYLHSDKDCGIVGIDNFCVEEVYFNDLQAIKVEGAESAITGRISEYTVTIKNKGARSASSYKVGLADENGKLLNELAEVNEAIGPGEVKTFRVKWTPSEAKEQKVSAIVKMDADADESNNLSASIIVHTQDPQVTRTVTLGKKEQVKAYPLLFDSPWERRSQTIYLASEINSPTALIASLKWYPNFYEKAVESESIEVYMANTTTTSAGDGWFKESDLTLVYKGTTQINLSQAELELTFENQFLYTGNNLCIYVKKLGAANYSWRDGFYCYSTEGQTNPTFYATASDRTDKWKPMVTFRLNSTGAKMSGQVTCNGNPVKDVQVILKESGQHTKTTEDGNYVFDLVNAGTYHVNYKLFGYFEVEKEIVVIDSEPFVENIELALIPQVAVSGQVVNSLNAPIVNAKVAMTGYQDCKVVTEANGRFRFENTYANGKYMLNIQAENYNSFSKELDMNIQSKLDLGSLKLNETPYPVYGLTIKENLLNWYEPVQQKECRYDDGKISQLGGLKGQYTSNKSLFGSVFPVSGKITKVKWFIASSNGEKQKKVNLFVMKVDENGKPLEQPLYIEENIVSACDDWFEYVLATPVDVTNGFLVGIGSSTESLNIGIDSGTDSEYPYQANKGFFTSNYEKGYLSTEIYEGNFMIRPTYIDINPTKLSTSGLIDGYKIYRLKATDEENKNNWQFLGKVNSLSYTDATLANAEQGYYRYAVSVDWKNSGESQTMLSATIAKDMLTDVSMCIASNVSDKKAITGSEVSLICDDGVHKYVSRLQNQDGTLTFTQVHKGVYTVIVSQPRFESFKKQSLDLSKNASYNLGTLTMKERLTAPVNLIVKEKEEGSGTYKLEWNLTSSIFDDFELHTDFALNSPGSTGWQYIDNDKGKKTYVIENVEYSNKGAGTAYTVFNPAMTKPRLDSNPEICAWSGDKYLASFSAAENANDDYLVSPELFFNEDFELSFYARAFTTNYGMERINVGYSKSDAEPGSFTWLIEADYLNIPNFWNKYAYTVPAYAKYVAIRCMSNNAFMLMLDDIQIGGTAPSNYKTYAKSYKVYLDGVCVSSLNTNTYELSVKGNGSHTIGVEAVYETGVSAMSTIKVNLETSISDEKVQSHYLNYIDDKLLFEGEAELIRVFSSTGAVVAGFTNVSEHVSLSSLPQGVYMVVADMCGERIMKKIIIR